MQQQTNWLPGIIVLAVAFVAAAAWLLLQRRKGTLAPREPRDGVLDDLSQRAQLLIDQLRALEADKHNLAPEQYTAEKSRLEHEAAAALRAKDEHLQRKASDDTTRKPAREAPAPTGWAARNPQLVGAVWGAGIVLFFGALSYFLVSEQKPRDDGEMTTGRAPPGMNAGAQQGQGMDPEGESPDMAEARQRLQSNPGDVEAASLLSHELIRRQSFEEAAKVTEKGLAADPFSVELRVHRGVLRATRGDLEGAEAELSELTDTWPDAQEALIFLGSLAMRRGDKAKALEHFERFSVEVPRNMQPPQLGPAIAQLRAEVSAGR